MSVRVREESWRDRPPRFRPFVHMLIRGVVGWQVDRQADRWTGRQGDRWPGRRVASRQLPGLRPSGLRSDHDPYEAALTSDSSTHASIHKNVHLSVSGEMRLTAEVLVASERACETASSRLGRSSSSASPWQSRGARFRAWGRTRAAKVAGVAGLSLHVAINISPFRCQRRNRLDRASKGGA